MTTEKDKRAIEEASELDDLEYARKRRGLAAELCITVGELDRMVRSARNARRPAPVYSDFALVDGFVETHACELRFVAKQGNWRIFDGSVWALDEKLEIFNRVRVACAHVAEKCADPRTSKALASARTVRDVETLARSHEGFSAGVDQWDKDPWLLNTPGGVVDLRSNSLRPARADDYMTKTTEVAPDSAMPCPIFDKFLTRITDGDDKLVNYLQRLAGYALTGVTSEQMLAFFHGGGANGKSVLLDTVAGIMGSYHATAPFETFAASKHEHHPTDIAGLVGARLVTTAETAEGRHWDETKIKQLTGGDRVKARFMRQDFFEFTPQFKLIVAGNHRPSLMSADEAMQRRMHMVPFDVTIPAGERDPDLKNKLRDEWPAILDWMIVGCLAWQEEGLNPPEAVIRASSEYMADEDIIGRWVAERCELDPETWTSSADLFSDFADFARSSNERVGTRKAFGLKLMRQEYVVKCIIPRRKDVARGFSGIALRRATSGLAQLEQLRAERRAGLKGVK